MLPRGITGFYDGHQPPPPILDEKCFDRFCYALARAHGGAVRSLDHDLSGKNFYAARLELRNTPCVLLVNAHYPYGAFAPSLDPWPPVFGDPPVDPTPFWPEVQWMTAAQLQQDWHGAVGELGEAEMEQIRCWNPRTVGEILFNFWD